MTHDERFEFVKRHILNLVPTVLHSQGAVLSAIENTVEEIVDRWEDELERLGMERL